MQKCANRLQKHVNVRKITQNFAKMREKYARICQNEKGFGMKCTLNYAKMRKN